MDPPQKGPVMRKMLPFYDVIIWLELLQHIMCYAHLNMLRCRVLYSDLRLKSDLTLSSHDDVIKWKHFPRYWSFVRESIGDPSVTGRFPSQRPVTRSIDVSFDLRLKISWANNRDAGDLRRQCPHYDVAVMWWLYFLPFLVHVINLILTKWAPFRRRHFQTHFLEWKC